MKKPLFPFIAVISAALFSACGGGGGTTTPPTVNKGPGTVQFSITVPQAPGSGTVSPQFAAPSGTQSVSIALSSVNGTSVVPGAPTIANISANAAGCSTASGQLTCAVSVQSPAGSDVFAITMYPQPNGQGTPIGAGQLTATAVSGQTVVAPATLNGTVASITLALPSVVVPEGQPATIALSLVAKDANGNVIIGSYANPIALADTDASGQTALSATSVTDSTVAASVTLKYKGGAMTQPATIAATAHNAANASQVTFQPDDSYPGVDKTTLTYGTSEIGLYGGGTFGTTPPVISENPSTGTLTVTVSTGASFNGESNLTDFHSVAEASPLPTVTTDEYYAWSDSASSASLVFAGSTLTEPSYMYGAPASDGTNDAVRCQAPYAATWTVPFPNEWDALTGSGACVEHRTIQNTEGGTVDVTTLDRTLNADGSYTSQAGYALNGAAETVTDTRVVNSDGTATQQVQWGQSVGMQFTTPSAIIVIGTPAPGASTIPYQITNFPGPVPSPGTTATPSPIATAMPNWYALAGVPGGVVPHPLASTTFTNKGVVAGLPPQCAVPLTLVSATVPITEIDETHSALDPVALYELDEYRYYVVAGMGPVCVQETSFMTSPGYLYLPPFAPSGGYSKLTAYLTAASVASALRSTRDVATAMPLAQAGLLAAVRAHDGQRRAAYFHKH